MNFSDLVGKVKKMVSDNPDAIRGGLDKVENTINERTGGKYQDKLAQGRQGLDERLGVPGEAKDAYQEGKAQDPGRPEQVQSEPIDRPTPVDRPEQHG